MGDEGLPPEAEIPTREETLAGFLVERAAATRAETEATVDAPVTGSAGDGFPPASATVLDKPMTAQVSKSLMFRIKITPEV